MRPRVFIPCPVCGIAIERARAAAGPQTLVCPACGTRFER